MKLKILFLSMLAVAFLSACNKDDDDDMVDPDEASISVEFDNLPASAQDEVYEGWIIVDGTPVSTGTFTVNDNGQMSESSFMVDPDDLEAATDFVLTIEPKPDNDPAPSSIKILGGSFSGSNATLSAGHPAALGNDFTGVGGKYIFATPTTSDMGDELSGLWFLSLASGSPMASLTLPTLPSNWKYEGWAVIDGTPVTTGTFTSADMADDADPYSGLEMAPPFPGEDFVNNAPMGVSFPTELKSTPIVISIEPHPDNSDHPFMFKPLFAMSPSDAMDHTDYTLTDNVSTSFPTGMAMKQ